jgi:phage terminase small subunit
MLHNGKEPPGDSGGFLSGVIKMAKLTAKRQIFVKEYLVDLNATQAAIRAGYSPKTANEQGARLLTNVSVADAVSREMAERSKRTGISADRIVYELAKIALLNPSDAINVTDATVRDNISDEDTACIASVKVKTAASDTGYTVEREIKFYDKIKALELLGKHNGMFKDDLRLSGDLDIKVAVDYGDHGGEQ